MNIEFIKILLEVREFSKNEYVRCNDYGYGYTDLIIKGSSYKQDIKAWILPSSSRFILAQYFLYQFDFNEWLNHESQNIKFESDMERYLNLKAFI